MIDRFLRAVGLRHTPPQTPTAQGPAPARLVRAVPSHITAAYDAAQTTAHSARMWRYADSLSADLANDLGVRKTIRERARYEYGSNSYCKGIVDTVANDLIGRGPSLHISLDDEDANTLIQQRWTAHARRIGLANKLRVCRKAECKDGEVFGEFVHNARLAGRVKIDLRVTECDQYTTPTAAFDPNKAIDGLEFDSLGNVTYYHRLKAHPGGWLYAFDYDRIPASAVVHLFHQDRPGQHRGISELAPCLALFQELRTYTTATISAAQTAAKYSAVLETTNAVVTDDNGNPLGATPLDAFSTVPIDYDTMVALPEGWKLNQFDAKQPVTQYDDFVRPIIREVARCLQMPEVIALNSATNASYAAGRLDVQTWDITLGIGRTDYEIRILDRLFDEWFAEAVLVGDLPAAYRDFDEIPRAWIWDNRKHVDPQKEANATASNIRVGIDHRAAAYARNNKDVDIEDQIAARSLGMDVTEYRRRLADVLFSNGNATAGRPPETRANPSPVATPAGREAAAGRAAERQARARTTQGGPT